MIREETAKLEAGCVRNVHLGDNLDLEHDFFLNSKFRYWGWRSSIICLWEVYSMPSLHRGLRLTLMSLRENAVWLRADFQRTLFSFVFADLCGGRQCLEIAAH